MVNENQIRNRMWQVVNSYVGHNNGMYVVDSFNLAKDTHFFFTNEKDATIPMEYHTIAMTVANQAVYRLNRL